MCESDRLDKSNNQNIPVMIFSIKKRINILNCLLIGNRGFLYNLVSRKLSGKFKEGKIKRQKNKSGIENLNDSLFGMTCS